MTLWISQPLLRRQHGTDQTTHSGSLQALRDSEIKQSKTPRGTERLVFGTEVYFLTTFFGWLLASPTTFAKILSYPIPWWLIDLDPLTSCSCYKHQARFEQALADGPCVP